MVVYQVLFSSIFLFLFLLHFSPCLQLVIGQFAVSLVSVFVRYRQGEWRPGKKTGFGVTFTHVSDTYHLLHQINMASECMCVGVWVWVCVYEYEPKGSNLSSYLPLLLSFISFLFVLHLLPYLRYWRCQPAWNGVLSGSECSQLCRGRPSLPQTLQ